MLRRALRVLRGLPRELANLSEARELLIYRSWGLYPDRRANPLTTHARRYWSQSDEDGILTEIFRRLGRREPGFFIEFGVGDGRENNTVALLARGWSGVWVGNEELVFDPVENGRLTYIKRWIDADNVVLTAELALLSASGRPLDLVSFDLDGNDYHLVRLLLESGIRPAVWVCEYNGRFPVGSRWVMPYSRQQSWLGDDYYGASISSMADLLAAYEYFPVACSVQGANLFAVTEEARSNFDDIPTDLEALYQPPFHHIPRRWGHTVSPRTLRSLTAPDRHR